MNINTIVWDYNGTILNDIDLCIDVMNGMLKRRSMPLISKNIYREKFTFPVRKYYELIGWDFNTYSFDDIGHEFIDGYRERLKEAQLFPGVKSTLSYLKNQGFTQHILSAMEGEFLHKSVTYLNVQDFFTTINGIENHLAKGKADIAKKIVRNGTLEPAKALMLGDTLHDAEIAQEFGMQCVLIANGHQPIHKLAKSGYPVINNLSEIESVIKT